MIFKFYQDTFKIIALYYLVNYFLPIHWFLLSKIGNILDSVCDEYLKVTLLL